MRDRSSGMWGDAQSCLVCMCAGGRSEDKQEAYISSWSFLTNPAEWKFPLFSFAVCTAVCLLITCSLFTYVPFVIFSWLSLVLTFFIHSWFVGFFFLLVKDLKVWRTDPGSIFDIDPLEDNIQSRSLRMLSGTACILSSSPCTWFCPESGATRNCGSPLCNVHFKVEDSKNLKKC